MSYDVLNIYHMQRFNGQLQWVNKQTVYNPLVLVVAKILHAHDTNSLTIPQVVGVKKLFMRKSKTPGNGELNDHVSFWIGFLFSNSGWLKEQVLNNPYDIRPNLLHAAQMHFLFVLSTAFHSRLERISAKSQPQDDPGRKSRAIWKSAQTLERNWKTFQLFEACFAVWWRRNESLQKKNIPCPAGKPGSSSLQGECPAKSLPPSRPRTT